jgi:hypothetical protein
MLLGRCETSDGEDVGTKEPFVSVQKPQLTGQASPMI